MILITHDLAVVADIADHVLVMYAGRILESAPPRKLFRNPQNPIPGLLGCTRTFAPWRQTGFDSGLPPDQARQGTECPFSDRCPED
jgi:ABC-type dipeptide/oligopeptide/nickel transport system ATPase component